MPYEPGDPWPGTDGGATPHGWSGYVRFYLQAHVDVGRPFTMGADDNDRLDAGNVMAYFDQPAEGGAIWADLTCDVMKVNIVGGSTSTRGVLSKAEAGTLVADLYDPRSKYDPLNPQSPYVQGGHSRLVPGTAIEAHVEVVDDPTAATVTVTEFPLFSGTADRWTQPWTRERSERIARLEATDPTKLFVKFDKPEQTPQGVGEPLLYRLQRIVDFFGWEGEITGPLAYHFDALQATTLAQPGWELVNRAVDDQIGFVHFTADGKLRFTSREQWTTRTPPVLELGCDPFLDIVTQAIPQSFDAQLINSVAASNVDGTMQTAESTNSIGQWGEQSYKRTDLGMLNDTSAADWAQFLVNLYAFPQVGLDRIRLSPDAAPEPWTAWQAVLAVQYVTDIVRVVWAEAGYVADVEERLVGHSYQLTPDRFEIEWRLVGSSQVTGLATFHMGDDPEDALDDGNVMA